MSEKIHFIIAERTFSSTGKTLVFRFSFSAENPEFFLPDRTQGSPDYDKRSQPIARVNGVQPPWWNLAPWMTELVWRMLACWGYLSGSKPAFTRETARSSQHCSRYSNARILSLYPDFHFYPLVETVDHMRLMWISASADPKHK